MSRFLSPRGERRHRIEPDTQEERNDDVDVRTSDEMTLDKGKAKEKKAKRPFIADSLMKMFKAPSKVTVRGPDAEETMLFNIEQVNHRLIQLEIDSHTVKDDHIRAILNTKHADGNPVRAAEFIDMEQKAAAGIIARYDPSVPFQGAVNRNQVTCYLDALLFSMFASLDTFECLLRAEFPDNEGKQTLVNLLRLWVSMLRSGKLIETDLTGLLLDTLRDCGWYGELDQQQDVSEVFCFLTDILQLPLLACRVTLAHEGKDEAGDNKIVKERTFDLAVPDVPETTVVRLEECFTGYLNTNVDISREATKAGLFWEEHARSSPPSIDAPISAEAVPDDDPDSRENSEISSSSAVPTASLATTVEPDKPSDDRESEPRDEQASGEPQAELAGPSSESEHTPAAECAEPNLTDTPRNGGDKPTETMPAWQFQRLLLPMFSKGDKPDKDLTEFERSLMRYHKNPIVGMCLKRYAMTESGDPIKRKTRIDIPERFLIPASLIAVWDTEAEADIVRAESDHRAILQSVICHRGETLQSGHYVTYARVADRALTENRRHDVDPPPDYQEAQWVLFDDLDVTQRVRHVDDLQDALQNETPYMVFYEIVPEYPDALRMGGRASDQMKLPTYDEAKTSLDGRTPDRRLMEATDSYFHGADHSSRPESRDQPQTADPRSPCLAEDAFQDREPGSPRDTGLLSPTIATNGAASTANNSLKASPNLAPYITADLQEGTADAASGADEPPTLSLNASQRVSRVTSRSFFPLRRGSRPVSQPGENRKAQTADSTTLSKRLSIMLRGNREQHEESLVAPSTNPTTTANSGAVTPAAETNQLAASDAETLTALLNQHMDVSEGAADTSAAEQSEAEQGPRLTQTDESGEKLTREIVEAEKNEGESSQKTKKHKGKKSKEDKDVDKKEKKGKGKSKDDDDRECLVM